MIKSAIYKIINEAFADLNETKADEIHGKYYREIPPEIFFKIIAADPTTPHKSGYPDKLGRYSQWLLRIFQQNNLRLEDLYKATDYLKYFHRFKGNELIQVKDINKLKSLPELYKAIEPLVQKIQAGEAPQSNTEIAKGIKQNEAEKVYEDNAWLVVVPITRRAACYYGRNTQWCTASTDPDSTHFDAYNARGKLYININKKTQEKYQFHFEDGQFMDATDNDINIVDFFGHKENTGLRNFYVKIAMEKNPKGIEIEDIWLTQMNGAFIMQCPNGYEDFVPFMRQSRNYNVKFFYTVLKGEGGWDEFFWRDPDDFDPRKYKQLMNAKNANRFQQLASEYDPNEQEGIDRLDALARAISTAAAEAQSNADESQAYTELVSKIHSHFGVIKSSWENAATGSEENPNVLRLTIQQNKWETFFIAGIIHENYGIHEKNPLHIEIRAIDTDGEIDADNFNQRLSDLFSEIK
jgi:hypothetical protein